MVVFFTKKTLPSISKKNIGTSWTCKKFKFAKGTQSGYFLQKTSQWTFQVQLKTSLPYNRGVFRLAMSNRTTLCPLVTRYISNCSQNIQMTNTSGSGTVCRCKNIEKMWTQKIVKKWSFVVTLFSFGSFHR